MRTRLAEIRRVMPQSQTPLRHAGNFSGIHAAIFVRPENLSRRRGSSCDAPPEGVRNYFAVNEATLASLGDYDFRPLLAKLTIPVLVVEGENSIPTTVASARAIAAAAPNATLALVPDAGHYPQVERPDIFFPIVDTFLSLISSPAAPSNSDPRIYNRRMEIDVASSCPRRARNGVLPCLGSLDPQRREIGDVRIDREMTTVSGKRDAFIAILLDGINDMPGCSSTSPRRIPRMRTLCDHRSVESEADHAVRGASFGQERNRERAAADRGVR